VAAECLTWHFLTVDVAIFLAADITNSFLVADVDNDVTIIAHFIIEPVFKAGH
jgi:hypothetical protein